jgi:hypothetical protein
VRCAVPSISGGLVSTGGTALTAAVEGLATASVPSAFEAVIRTRS